MTTIRSAFELMGRAEVQRLQAAGLGPDWLEEIVRSRLSEGEEANRIRGRLRRLDDAELPVAPVRGTAEWSRQRAVGVELLASGAVAFCVLAGGMATRMGGVVKALVEILPGRTFLDLRLDETERIATFAGQRPPLWLMTSGATDAPIRAAIESRGAATAAATFRQYESLRLEPSGAPFVDADGRPSPHATGHGDLPQALAESGLLQAFLERGGRYVVIANLDNVGATIDPALLALHVERGRELTVEVVAKRADDRGGIPLAVDGHPMVVEEFRLPASFAAGSVPYFNTNTLIVEAEALAASVDFEWTWCLARKSVGGRSAIQFERLLGELARGLSTGFIVVPRDGDRSRFLPVKDLEELDRIRPAVEARIAALES